MSAYLVENETIDSIINYAIEYDMIPLNRACEIGQNLLEENQESVNYRYCRNEKCPTYIHTRNPVGLKFVKHAVESYIYQACEHPNFEKSLASTLTKCIRLHVDNELKK